MDRLHIGVCWRVLKYVERDEHDKHDEQHEHVE